MKEWNPKIVTEMIENNEVEKLHNYMNEYNLYIKDGTIVSKYKEEFKELHVFWDQRQHVRKFCGINQ